MTVRTSVVASALGALLAAGCGSPAEQPPGGPQSPSTTSPASPTSAAGESPSGPVKTLRGTVEEGVEAGCLVLNTDGGAYLLLGGEQQAALKPGAKVEVTGRIAADVASFCQQGAPFVVQSVKPR